VLMADPRKQNSSFYSVRPMGADDTPSVAALAVQLGYGPTAEQVGERFNLLREQPTVGFYVAYGDDPVVITGWIHVYGVHTLVSTPYAEIGGIVVDESARLSGVGSVLMHRAEAWALDRGYKEVRLRSGHHREGAHKFYQSIGYEIARGSHTFRRYL
jgi:GNAT superfamily N-acetyltransferase